MTFNSWPTGYSRGSISCRQVIWLVQTGETGHKNLSWASREQSLATLSLNSCMAKTRWRHKSQQRGVLRSKLATVEAPVLLPSDDLMALQWELCPEDQDSDSKSLRPQENKG